MTITREFCDGDRYRYDWMLVPKGWAQLDTDQDASWFGYWADPEKLITFCFCEGDCTTCEFEQQEAFSAEIRRAAKWHSDNDGWLRIDPCESSRTTWEALGLADLLA